MGAGGGGSPAALVAKREVKRSGSGEREWIEWIDDNCTDPYGLDGMIERLSFVPTVC